jgi:hypothetical protein
METNSLYARLPYPFRGEKPTTPLNQEDFWECDIIWLLYRTKPAKPENLKFIINVNINLLKLPKGRSHIDMDTKLIDVTLNFS